MSATTCKHGRHVSPEHKSASRKANTSVLVSTRQALGHIQSMHEHLRTALPADLAHILEHTWGKTHGPHGQNTVSRMSAPSTMPARDGVI